MISRVPPRGRPANVAPRDAPRLAGTSTRPTCEVTALGDGCHGVRLSGRFLPGWAGRLAASLAARGISVLHGHAERLSAHGWEVELELRSSNAAMDLGRLDLVALTREERGGAAPTGDVPLSRVRIARGESEIEVEVQGRDQVGFLDGILRVFAFYALFPRTLDVGLDGAEARGTFRLQGLGGGPPSADAADALEIRLRELAPRGQPG